MDNRYFGHNTSGFWRWQNICPRLCLGQTFSHLPKPSGLWQISAIHLWVITYILTLRTFFIIVKYIWYFYSYGFFLLLKKNDLISHFLWEKYFYTVHVSAMPSLADLTYRDISSSGWNILLNFLVTFLTYWHTGSKQLWIYCMYTSLLFSLLPYQIKANTGISLVLYDISFWSFFETFLGYWFTNSK